MQSERCYDTYCTHKSTFLLLKTLKLTFQESERIYPLKTEKMDKCASINIDNNVVIMGNINTVHSVPFDSKRFHTKNNNSENIYKKCFPCDLKSQEYILNNFNTLPSQEKILTLHRVCYM